MLESLFRVRGGTVDFRTIGAHSRGRSSAPSGFQFDYEHLDSDELWRRGRAVGAVINGRLYLILLDAARIALFRRRAARLRSDRQSARRRLVKSPRPAAASASRAGRRLGSPGRLGSPEAWPRSAREIGVGGSGPAAAWRRGARPGGVTRAGRRVGCGGLGAAVGVGRMAASSALGGRPGLLTLGGFIGDARSERQRLAWSDPLAVAARVAPRAHPCYRPRTFEGVRARVAELVDALVLGPVSQDVGVRVPPRAPLPATAADRARASSRFTNRDMTTVIMKTVETENEGLKRAFMLTIPAKDIEARVDQEVKRIAPQVRMPGFRPGKVPPNLIRKMHGDSAPARRAQQRGPGGRPAAAQREEAPPGDAARGRARRGL